MWPDTKQPQTINFRPKFEKNLNVNSEPRIPNSRLRPRTINTKPALQPPTPNPQPALATPAWRELSTHWHAKSRTAWSPVLPWSAKNYFGIIDKQKEWRKVMMAATIYLSIIPGMVIGIALIEMSRNIPERKKRWATVKSELRSLFRWLAESNDAEPVGRFHHSHHNGVVDKAKLRVIRGRKATGLAWGCRVAKEMRLKRGRESLRDARFSCLGG